MVDMDKIISELDERPLPNASRVSLVREIFAKIGYSDNLEREVVGIGADVTSASIAAVVEKAYENLKSNPDSVRARLLVASIPSEQELDGYDAEFLIGWAKKAGLSEQDIVGAFQPYLSPCR